MDLSKVKTAQNTENQSTEETPTETPVDSGTPDIANPTEVPEKRFQHYRSDRRSMQMRTTIGTLIAFIDHKFITDNPEVIDYLDIQIDSGVKGIHKGELLTAKEADPMERLKEKHIKEYIEEQEKKKLAEMKGEYREMGSTKAPGSPVIGAASTRTIADNASGSTSSSA